METALAVDENVALSRFTTLGTGGPARSFAGPQSSDELRQLLRWAADRGLAVETIGLGSNLLAHDDGVDAVVLKLAGSLAEARIEGETLMAGGGAPNAVCLHRARGAGLRRLWLPSAVPASDGARQSRETRA